MKCKCDFRTRMVGDGCDVCNPAKSLEYARETIDEQAALIEEMGEAHEKLLKLVQSVFKVQGWDSGEYVEVAVSQAALSKWEESK